VLLWFTVCDAVMAVLLLCFRQCWTPSGRHDAPGRVSNAAVVCYSTVFRSSIALSGCWTHSGRHAAQ
jgi:hypothetical protein